KLQSFLKKTHLNFILRLFYRFIFNKIRSFGVMPIRQMGIGQYAEGPLGLKIERPIAAVGLGDGSRQVVA
ncbi:MAG: hypothetical protein C7N36_04195, partial [Bacteroidetes bacterium]